MGPKRFRRRMDVCMTIFWVLCTTAALRSMFILRETENVPIERVLQNLERRAAESPRDVQIRINLARVHAMAYASKSETAPVAKSRNVADVQSNDPEFGVLTSQFGDMRIRPAADAAATEVARQHLNTAIANYDIAISIDPANLIARIGRAWCIDQSGDKPRAIAAYRDVLKDAWARESAPGGLPIMNFTPLTVEITGYLLPLLDPQKDAAEIREAQSHLEFIRRAPPRPITPIAIPLQDDLAISDLVDHRAQVTFDADGSGIEKSWTWITPKAGWLVFDKLGRRQPESALDWFGNVTFWLFWENGYQALSILDDNGDGDLTGSELDGLAIWQDRNGNGVSDPEEVRSLAEWHITKLSCAYAWRDDDPAAIAWSPSGVTFQGGRVRPTFDLLLYTQPKRNP